MAVRDLTWGLPEQKTASGRIHRLRRLAGNVRSALASLGRPHRAALVNLTHMPLTVIGYGAVDFAAFHLGHGWGWLVTGISLMVLELQLADE